jgi:hypothetical protein
MKQLSKCKQEENLARTLAGPFKKTRLLSRFILSTSCIVLSSSPRKRMRSPGTIFQNLIRSVTRTDFNFGSCFVCRTSQARGMRRRWLKLHRAGFFVVAFKAVLLVKYLRDIGCEDLLLNANLRGYIGHMICLNLC